MPKKRKRFKPRLFAQEEVTHLKTRSGAGPHKRGKQEKKRYRAWEVDI